MPTYTYECTKCAHRFELFHSIADSSEKNCPECGAPSRHVISGGAGLIFKGTGFYQTDYKAKNNTFNNNGNGHTPSKEKVDQAIQKAESKKSSTEKKEKV